MRAAVIRPGDDAALIVDMPDDADDRNRWLHEQVGELLDFTTLAAWSRAGRGWWTVSMVNNDFFDGLPDNEVASRLYDPDARRLGCAGWRIRGPIVVFAYNHQGDSIPLPEQVTDLWLVHGIPVREGGE